MATGAIATKIAVTEVREFAGRKVCVFTFLHRTGKTNTDGLIKSYSSCVHISDASFRVFVGISSRTQNFRMNMLHVEA